MRTLARRSSPRIRNLTLMVVGFGVTHKLFGFTWKAAMKQAHPSTAAYAALMGDVASLTGATTIFLMLVSKFIFQVRPRAAGARSGTRLTLLQHAAARLCLTCRCDAVTDRRHLAASAVCTSRSCDVPAAGAACAALPAWSARVRSTLAGAARRS